MKLLIQEINKLFSIDFFNESVNFLKYNKVLKINTSLALAQFYVDQASCFSQPEQTFEDMISSLDNINFNDMNTFKNEVMSKSSASYITT